MVFENIEQLKREYTDKYVVVDDTKPELQRFSGQTGYVKTVNMSGRALVQFDAHSNIGWYDIDIDFLKVVDQPVAKVEAKGGADKPAAKVAAAAKPTAVGKDAGGTKPAAAKGGAAMSAADVLAAARAGTKPAPKTPAASGSPAPAKSAQMSVADILAAARGKEPAPAAEPKSASPKGAPAQGAPVKAPSPKAAGSMSVEEILAAARAKKDAAVADPSEATVPSKGAPAEKPPVVPPASKAPAAKAPATAETLPTDVAAIVAWCQARDKK